MPQDWDIKPRASACSACEQPFEDRQPIFSVLLFGEQGYSRGDFCGGCWHGKGRSLSSYSSWKGVFRSPPPPPEEPLKKETAESLLRRMMETPDPAQAAVIYILAVMLERKRVLVERDVQTREDGATVRVYEHRKTGESFLVPDPRLGFDRIEEVQTQVVAMLGGPEKPSNVREESAAQNPAATPPGLT